jgi:prepilin-type N-terminal cleavage/methylation domain-containing protein
MNTQTEEFQAKKRDKGFTLVELLIVIVILGVLSTVTVFAVRGITSRGEDARCETDQRTVEVAVEAYVAENGDFPANMAALVPDFLREASTLHSIDAAGNVTAIGDCA